MLRLQRAIRRGLRGQYLNQHFYLNKEKIIRSEVKIIDKKYLYQHVRASWWFFICGYACCGMSPLFLAAYIMTDHLLFLMIFTCVFSIGIVLVDYYSIRTLNLRKTILIIDHWLRRTGEVDLTKIDKEFGFLPIKYSLSSLKNMAKRYESFLRAKLIKNQEILQFQNEFATN